MLKKVRKKLPIIKSLPSLSKGAIMKNIVTSIIILFIATSLFPKEIEKLDAVVGSGIIKPPKKSMPKAMMYSIMLPGWGNFYAGNKGTGKVLLGAEIAIWLGYFGFQYYGNIQKDDYMLYAHEKAGANFSRKGEDYYDAVEVHWTSEEYNRYVMEDARLLYPNDPELQNQYVQEHGYFGKDGWEWNGESVFMRYRRMRISTRETFQRASFMTGFAILNRLCAAITSSRNVRNYNKRIEEIKWGVEFLPNRVSVVYRF